MKIKFHKDWAKENPWIHSDEEDEVRKGLRSRNALGLRMPQGLLRKEILNLRGKVKAAYFEWEKENE